MRYILALGVFASLVVGGQAVYAAQVDCEPARCALQAAIDKACPCSIGVPAGTTAANHGQHVSCVAHQVNMLAKSGMIPKNCKGKITKCAAKSICGWDANGWKVSQSPSSRGVPSSPLSPAGMRG